MSYKIKNYTKEKAHELGVQVKPSSNKGKKIDVYKDGEKIASVGALGMKDYPTYIQEEGIEYANKRKQLYTMRHQKEGFKKGTNSYWALKLLWA